MTVSPLKKNYHLPVPGQRIIRSMVAMWICMLIYYLRGRDGLPFLSVIAALQCIQPYSENSLVMGRKRIIGTLIGAVWGTAVLYFEFLATGNAGLEEMLHFLLMGAVAGAVIYSTVLLKMPENAYFSTVVFLSIVMNHATDTAPVIYVIDRVIDTTVGVFVGFFVNSLHLPRLRKEGILFLTGLDHIAAEKGHVMSPYTKIELNRLISDGADFSVITRQTPAMIREMMSDIRLKLPVIAMDGAVMYDMNERKYLRKEMLDEELGKNISNYLKEENAHFFINTIEDQLLVTFYYEMVPGPMEKLYLQRKSSIHRNFVHTEREITENILYITVVGNNEEIQKISSDLVLQPFYSQIRIKTTSFDCPEGVELLRIYNARATREKMVERLKEYVSAGKQLIKFGSPEEWADDCFPYAGDDMIRQMKKIFEPVSIKGWRNMIRI